MQASKLLFDSNIEYLAATGAGSIAHQSVNVGEGFLIDGDRESNTVTGHENSFY